MKYHINQLRDYSSLFSRNEVLSWLKMDFVSMNYKIERYDEKWLKSKDTTYLDYLKYVYKVLVNNYNNEYVYKNEFLNNWLIAKLGETNSQIFSEFRVGDSIADLVMFNGCSKIFEIKSELDSDARLNIQLENYRKAFNEIYIIIPNSKLSYYTKYDKTIGLITFDPNSQNTFSLERNAKTDFNIDPSSIMTILHSKEYKSIVKKYYGNIPDMTSFTQYNICRDLMLKIPKHKLNKLFIDEIKERGRNSALSLRYYKEFNQLFLALKMSQETKNKMIYNLKSPIKI